MVVVEVEAAFTDRDDLLAAQVVGVASVDERQDRVEPELCIVRVEADRRPHVVVACGDGECLASGVCVGADDDHLVYVVRGGVGDGAVGAARCAVVIHVAVRVHPCGCGCGAVHDFLRGKSGSPFVTATPPG